MDKSAHRLIVWRDSRMRGGVTMIWRRTGDTIEIKAGKHIIARMPFDEFMRQVRGAVAYRGWWDWDHDIEDRPYVSPAQARRAAIRE